MNDNDTPEITETETPADAEDLVQASVEVEDQSLLHRLKTAGETGKKEWEQALSHARAFFSQACEDAEGEENPAQTAFNRIQEQGQDLFGRAQTRGADLLLGLIVSVRKGAQSLEESLREARERAQVEVEVAVEAPAVA